MISPPSPELPLEPSMLSMALTGAFCNENNELVDVANGVVVRTSAALPPPEPML